MPAVMNAANEIAVSSVLKESNDLDLGSVIDLTCPDGSTVSFSIVGFFDNPEKARLIVGSEQSVILAQEGFTTFISASNSPAILFSFHSIAICQVQSKR